MNSATRMDATAGARPRWLRLLDVAAALAVARLGAPAGGRPRDSSLRGTRGRAAARAARADGADGAG